MEGYKDKYKVHLLVHQFHLVLCAAPTHPSLFESLWEVMGENANCIW